MIFKKKNIKYILVFALTIVAFVIMLFPKAGEIFGFVSEFLNWSIGGLFSLIPFSMLSLLICLIPVLLGLIVWRAVVSVRQKRFRVFAKRATCLVCVCFVYFSFILGLNYRKESIYDKLGFVQAETNTKSIAAMSDFFIGKLNDSAQNVNLGDENRNLIVPKDFTVEFVQNLVFQEFEKYDFDFLYDFNLKPKRMFLTTALSDMGFDGIYFPFFAEINIGGDVSVANLCITLTHEIIHSKGILNESEASFLAEYICFNSDNDVFKYVASYTIVLQMLRYLHINDTTLYQSSLKKIDDVFLKKRIGFFAVKSSQSENNFFTRVSNFFYDIYLKLNFVNDGIDSYDNDIAGWVRWYNSTIQI